MYIQPTSFSFTLLLGFLAAVPYSGIDINLPALAATGATLGVSPSDIGLTMSAFMLSLAVAPLIYGPVSDRYGRKPVILFGLALFILASMACAAARSLPALLAFRFVQGVGAASTATTFAITRDLFGEAAARARIAATIVAVNVVTVIAPTAGAALLALGNWRLIYTVQAATGAVLLFTTSLGFAESARFNPTGRLRPVAVVRDYFRVLTHPVSAAYILVGAAAGSAVFAYATGSSLFFIGAAGLRPNQYGLIFSACSAAVMSGALLDRCLGRLGVSAPSVLSIGLALSAAAAGALLAMTVAGSNAVAPVIVLLIVVALAFGMTLPNIMNATMQPLPDIAGAVGAATSSIQMTAGSLSSALVAVWFDGRSALSMAAVMAACSLLALIGYWLLARPAERHFSLDDATDAQCGSPAAINVSTNSALSSGDLTHCGPV